MMKDEIFMAEAMALAKEALDAGEVPVGALIVKDGEVIARGRNDREEKNSPLGHAEVNAISAAAKQLGDWRLSGCTLYVTLEPCSMCAGAIINSRIDRVVYAAADEAAGCFGSVINMAHLPGVAPIKISAGPLAEQSRELLAKFFGNLRENGKK